MTISISGSTGITFPSGFTQVDSAGFPSGTVMLFVQTAAPTGWTKSTTHDNKALRVVSGTAGSGGSVDFTTAFNSQAVSGTVGDTTLSTAQIPSHTHAVTDPGHVHSINANPNDAGAGSSLNRDQSASQTVNSNSATTGISIGATGGGGSHTHSFSGSAINLAVQYVDTIIATKD